MSDAKNPGNKIELSKEELKTQIEVCIPDALKKGGWNATMFYVSLRDQMAKSMKQGPPPKEDIFKFAYVSWRTGLDPLANQIYAVYRWNTQLGREVMSIQTGIDGMRLVAQRTGDYAGQDDIVYTPVDESTKYPIKATCTVYKMVSGQKVSFTATARWEEYKQETKNGLGVMWAKMPYLMIGKCAEALALRKAFPTELSGIYAEEEIQRDDVLMGITPPPVMNNKPKIEVISGNENQGQVSTPPAPAIPGEPPVVGSPESAIASQEIKKEEAKPSPAGETATRTVEEMQQQIVTMRERLKKEKEAAEATAPKNEGGQNGT
jgi:phage recombination protein Bet